MGSIEFVIFQKNWNRLTFWLKYNPDQFEIVGSNRGVNQDPKGIYGRGSFLNGKEAYRRLFIQNRKPIK